MVQLIESIKLEIIKVTKMLLRVGLKSQEVTLKRKLIAILSRLIIQ